MARVLEVDFFETRFSRFLAWRDFGFPGDEVYNCFAMPALRSLDGAYLLGEMGPGHSVAGLLYFPAGTPDPSDVVGDRVDLAGSVVRELAEETGFYIEPAALKPGWRVIRDCRRVACMKLIDWPLTSAQMIAEAERFIASEEAPELSRVHMIAEASQVDDWRIPLFMRAFLYDAL